MNEQAFAGWVGLGKEALGMGVILLQVAGVDFLSPSINWFKGTGLVSVEHPK